jgi:hypothetical protein
MVKRWDMCVCWWWMCQVFFFFFSFEYDMLYVLYPFVTYLLTLPHTYDSKVTFINES